MKVSTLKLTRSLENGEHTEERMLQAMRTLSKSSLLVGYSLGVRSVCMTRPVLLLQKLASPQTSYLHQCFSYTVFENPDRIMWWLVWLKCVCPEPSVGQKSQNRDSGGGLCKTYYLMKILGAFVQTKGTQTKKKRSRET